MLFEVGPASDSLNRRHLRPLLVSVTVLEPSLVSLVCRERESVWERWAVAA